VSKYVFFILYLTFFGAILHLNFCNDWSLAFFAHNDLATLQQWQPCTWQPCSSGNLAAGNLAPGNLAPGNLATDSIWI